MRKVQFYSIRQSFGDDTKGSNSHQIVNTTGSRKLLGKSLWEAGDKAYSVLKAALRQENDFSGSIDDHIDEVIDDLIDQADAFLCSDFYPSMLEMIDQGRIGLDKGDKASFIDAWAAYGLPARFLIFSQFIDGNPLAFKESSDFVPFTCRLAAVSVLAHIDDAVLCMISDDDEGLLACGIDIEKCKAYLSPPTKLFVAMDMAVKMALSENANKGASAKLANDKDGKQKNKAVVRECWNAWQKEPGRYKGKAAFARDMREKFPTLESQPVIEGWCRIWERET